MKYDTKLLVIEIELLVLIILGVAGGYLLFKDDPQLKQAIALATTVKSETFTELYFENHTKLPKNIVRGEKYNFTFTTHNVEHEVMTYPYEVYLLRGNQKVNIEQGEFNLDADATKSITVNFGPVKKQKAKIVVNLVNKDQTIAFWMDSL